MADEEKLTETGRWREWPPGSGARAWWEPFEEEEACAIADAARAAGIASGLAPGSPELLEFWHNQVLWLVGLKVRSDARLVDVEDDETAVVMDFVGGEHRNLPS